MPAVTTSGTGSAKWMTQGMSRGLNRLLQITRPFLFPEADPDRGTDGRHGDALERDRGDIAVFGHPIGSAAP